MKKLGVAISVYDKLDCVKTNINIIRNHWKSNKDSFVSVCCNDKDTLDQISNMLEINSIVQGDQISTSTKAERRMRIFDCLRKSTLACQSEYIIHYHADAFALSEKPILELINHMEENNYNVAFRGKGLEYRNPKTFAGDVDDHFLIFKRSEILNRSLFKISNEEAKRILTVGNVETLLSILIQEAFKKEEIFYYDDMRLNIVHENCIDKDGFYSDGISHRDMNPFNIDPNRSFYHIGDKNRMSEILLGAGIPKEMICVTSNVSKSTVYTKVSSEESHIEEWINE